MASRLEKKLFEWGLKHPWLFRKVMRPALYRKHNGDFGEIHCDALRILNENVDVLREQEERFDFPELQIPLNGRIVLPFGTAAGVDKDGDALIPLSYIFGFQESGTFVVAGRQGNQKPREAVDDRGENLFNAQGFPSRGLGYALERLEEYKKSDCPKNPLYLSVCGIPPAEESTTKALDRAWEDMEILLEKLGPYADGFVWDPFSPNTAALRLLREPGTFRIYAEAIKRRAPQKLSLVKMGPYDDSGRSEWLALMEAWMEGGGHGIVAVNTYMVPKEQVPSKGWGYPSAGKSGRFLRPYREKAVKDARRHFPEAVIFAAGGISDGDDAYETFRLGATAIEGYTPYTFHGFGLVRKIMKGVYSRLKEEGYTNADYPNLQMLQEHVRGGRELVCNRRK